MSHTVLLIDDDTELCGLLGEFLAPEGFAVTAVHSGLEALPALRDSRFDLIVLDIMLPGMQGLEVLRELRHEFDTPVLMLTARGEDTDRIIGLELGADDYLPKPCNPRELAARLRALLRRSRPARLPHYSNGELRLQPGTREASYAGKDLALTSAEFNVLQGLLARCGQVVDKDTLSREALGRALTAYDRSVDVHISKLRRKLAGAGAEELIVSVRGVGYQLLDRQETT